jgi:hypothetical protein
MLSAVSLTFHFHHINHNQDISQQVSVVQQQQQQLLVRTIRLRLTFFFWL